MKRALQKANSKSHEEEGKESSKQLRDDTWGFNKLWTPEAQTKCKAVIPDTVLFEDGEPTRWLFTSRNGDIVKKRAVTVQALEQSCAKATGLEGEGASLVIRYSNGRIKRESIGQLTKFLSPTNIVDCSIETLQVVPKGRLQNGIYRNKYSVINDTGKVSFKTEKLVPLGTSTMVSGSCTIAESRASTLNEMLNNKTQSIIRFLENTCQVRIVSGSLDYLFDRSSTDDPMLVWVSNMITVTGRAAKDLTLIGLTGENGRLSGELSGFTYGFPKEKPSRPRTPRKRVPSSNKQFTKAGVFHKEQFALSTQVDKAVARIETDTEDSTDFNLSGESKFPKSEDSEITEQYPNPLQQFKIVPFPCREERLPANPSHKHCIKGQHARQNFPTPFACHGDFCDFHIQDPANLAKKQQGRRDEELSTEGISLQAFRALFTHEEVQDLQAKTEFQTYFSGLDQISHHQRVDDFTNSEHFITFKSIILSKLEKRNKRQSREPRKHQPTRFEQPKLCQLERISPTIHASRGGVNVANYYSKVRVCENCFRVYMTLDKARELLQKINTQSAALYPENGVECTRSSTSQQATECLAQRLSTKSPINNTSRRKGRGSSSDPFAKNEPRSLGSRTPSPIRSARKYMQKVTTKEGTSDLGNSRAKGGVKYVIAKGKVSIADGLNKRSRRTDRTLKVEDFESEESSNDYVQSSREEFLLSSRQYW